MLNKFNLQGHMVRNPELKKSNDGRSVCEFTIGWNYGKIKLFQNCVSYDKIAENIAKYFDKGQEIIVSGQLFTQQWKHNGKYKRHQNKMTVNEVHFVGPKQRQEEKEISEYEWEDVTDEEIENLNW